VTADQPRRAFRPHVDENDLMSGGGSAGAGSFEALLDVSMPLIVEIGRANMTVQDVLHLGVGSVVQLDRAVGEPVDIYVSDRKLAQGEVVVVGDRFGIRVTRILHTQGSQMGAGNPVSQGPAQEQGLEDAA